MRSAKLRVRRSAATEKGAEKASVGAVDSKAGRVDSKTDQGSSVDAYSVRDQPGRDR